MKHRFHSKGRRPSASTGLDKADLQWLAALSQAVILHVQFLRKLRRHTRGQSRRLPTPDHRRVADLATRPSAGCRPRSHRPCLVTLPRRLTIAVQSLLPGARA